MNQEEEKPREELNDARSFAVLLAELDGGTVHADASKGMRQLVNELYELALNSGSRKGVKGRLTLTLDVSVLANGTASVDADVNVKIPKPKRLPSTMFVTKDGNLSAQNERQLKLGLREVKPNNEPARDVGAPQQETRSV